ncbi:TetR family transcriptional regulator [Pseudonocardia acaciae]|uniref:TetR family transcriptional regulator n=1 Tax=Pseudonocardia acaciae TaxID=551276 RepID=UPI000688E841|nr:TetR family transcriptional regulator [Pseudonocardia acaciae]
MPRDASDTRRRILEAAVEEFAAYGIAGARVERIARNANANKRAIYEQFGDKTTLFSMVLGHELDKLAHAVEPRPDNLAEYVGELFDYCAENPRLVRLVQWEALSFPPRQAPNFAQRSTGYAAKVDAVAAAQRAGHINADMPAERVLMLLIGLAEWTLYVPQLAQMIIGHDPADLEQRAHHRAFLVATAGRLLGAGALTSPARGGGSPG